MEAKKKTRMKHLILPALLILATLSTACNYSVSGFGVGVTGSGRLVDKQFALDDFTRVEIGHGATLNVTQGAAYATTITADDNLMEYLIVEKRGDALHIGLKAGSYRNVTLRASVSMPALRGLTLSGGSRGEVAGFRSGDPFQVNVSGGSQLTGDIQAGAADLIASGGSRITLKGAGASLTLNGSGGSPIEMGDFAVAGEGRITLSGGTRAVINLSGRLDADLSGGSQLRYVGSPTLGKVNSSGGSQLSAR
jgi:predicted small secreted protein